MITVYTDGACSFRNGGWAWWVSDDEWLYGSERDTTNNCMEMQAVAEALRWMKQYHPDDPLLIVSDSAYVVNCFADQWYVKWRKNGWVNSSRKPVENRDLWEELLWLYEHHPAPITFRHCRGHGRGGVADAEHVLGNAQADRLAVAARKTLVL